MNKDKKAFTLVEVVLTIIIVVVLSSISVPVYKGYSQKAKYAEGYALIGNIMKAEDIYRAEYGNFYYLSATWAAAGTIYTQSNDVLGINVSGNKYFTTFTLQCNTGTTADAGSSKWFVKITLPHRINGGKKANGATYNENLVMEYCLTSIQKCYES